MRVIAIDGPSGSGKSTVARTLAERLGLRYLDTGAMYRAVAFAAMRRGIDPAEAEPVARMVGDVTIELLDGGTVHVDGVDATIEIRGPEVTRAVSAVAANPAVRTELVRRQRAWIEANDGGVVEGRDIATVVWPDAELKVYLEADLSVRAGRRQKEVIELDYEQVAADMTRRDTIDATRDADPLQQAGDAVVIDTTELGIDEVVDRVLERLAP